MSERIKGSYDNALYKSTYTLLLLYTNHKMFLIITRLVTMPGISAEPLTEALLVFCTAISRTAFTDYCPDRFF